MKNKKCFLLFLVSFGIYISSCQKEINVESGNNPFPPSGNVKDSNYLDKLYFIDSIAGSKDTLVFYTYLYDTNRRLLNISHYYSHLTSLGPNLSKSQYFFYNGTDTLPFKRAEYDYEEALFYSSQYLVDTSISMFKYDGLGRKTFDSTHETDHFDFAGSNGVEFRKIISHFSYNARNVYVQKTATRLGGTNPVVYSNTFTDTAFFDATDNLISLKSYGSIMPGMYILGTFTYDNHPSPFAKLSNFASLDFFKTSELFWPLLQSRNNPQLVLSEIIGGSGGFYQDYTNMYTYNTDGYPLRIVQPDSLGGPNYYITEFKYRKL